MPHGSIVETIRATSAEVFSLLHDYDRRLEWDTLLRKARLCGDAQQAGLHVRSECQGRWYLGGISLTTEYVQFVPPTIAAVKMVNRPLFFETLAATIRHCDLDDGTSTIEHQYTFTTRPAWLRWLIQPIVHALFRHETARRLRSLSRWFSRSRSVE